MELQASEVGEIENCFGFTIKKIRVELHTNDSLAILRGYTPRYFSEIELEYDKQINEYSVKVVSNGNPALTLDNFQSCLTNISERIGQAEKHNIEIEFESDIALENKVAEFEKGMQWSATHCIERFGEADPYFKRHHEEVEYLKNASEEFQKKISNEFDKSYAHLMRKYLVQLKQDSITDNKLSYQNFDKLLQDYQDELDNLLADIVNANR